MNPIFVIYLFLFIMFVFGYIIIIYAYSDEEQRKRYYPLFFQITIGVPFFMYVMLTMSGRCPDFSKMFEGFSNPRNIPIILAGLVGYYVYLVVPCLIYVAYLFYIWIHSKYKGKMGSTFKIPGIQLVSSAPKEPETPLTNAINGSRERLRSLVQFLDKPGINQETRLEELTTTMVSVYRNLEKVHRATQPTTPNPTTPET